VSGFEVVPAEVRLMFPHERHQAVFWQLWVTGWGGISSPESGIRQLEDPNRPGKLVYGPCTNLRAIIDPRQWDGSDFFFVWPLPAFWWITPKVVDILQQNKLKWFRLVPPEQLTTLKEETVDGIAFMPGRLRYYFDDERARLIGEPLGIY
jgi:hypothetical protein